MKNCVQEWKVKREKNRKIELSVIIPICEKFYKFVKQSLFTLEASNTFINEPVEALSVSGWLWFDFEK